MRLATSFLVLVGCAFIAGCSNEPALAPVTGTVTMNGKPLKNVKVTFQPNPDKGTRGAGSTGVTDDSGSFTLKYEGLKDGAIVGHHRVILTDLDLFGNVYVGRGEYRTEGPGGPKETPKVARFPNVYSDLPRTPLEVEVKTGMAPVTIDVKANSETRPGGKRDSR